jgi:alpha-amylase
MTEDLGNATILFPISKRLRYTIPFEDPQQTIDYLRSMATEDGQNIIVFADDGEKFGAWPNTYDHVYNQKWLERFFGVLEENSYWINILHFHEAIQLAKPLGKIYLPTASYSEMMQWALFPATFQAYEDFEHYLKGQDFYEDVHVFVRGGFWRNFLAKYLEVNGMHKKMLRVSKKLWDLPKKKQQRAKEAFENLWAGQCNCPYWHGVFGGLYLSHLRDATFSNLIKAETIADELADKKFPQVELSDLDVDGFNEVIVENKSFNAYINIANGGMIYELDYKLLNKNIFDTMTRRKEGYHKKLQEAVVAGSQSAEDKTASIHDLVIAKEPDLASKLFYDFYERKSYIDHFLNESTTLDSFACAQYGEDGDFFNQTYELVYKKVSKDRVRLKLQRSGNVWYQGKYEPLKLIKVFEFMNNDGLIIADYTIYNETGKLMQLWFGVEFNFGMQAGHTEDRYYYLKDGEISNKFLDSKAELENIQSIGLRDDWRKLDIQIECEKKGSIWRFPIETISLSEGGFERVYQSSAVFPNWKIELQKKWQTSILLKINTVV